MMLSKDRLQALKAIVALGWTPTVGDRVWVWTSNEWERGLVRSEPEYSAWSGQTSCEISFWGKSALFGARERKYMLKDILPRSLPEADED